jgi:hypothetical protein
MLVNPAINNLNNNDDDQEEDEDWLDELIGGRDSASSRREKFLAGEVEQDESSSDDEVVVSHKKKAVLVRGKKPPTTTNNGKPKTPPQNASFATTPPAASSKPAITMPVGKPKIHQRELSPTETTARSKKKGTRRATTKAAKKVAGKKGAKIAPNKRVCLKKQGFQYSCTEDEVIMDIVQKSNSNLNWYGRVKGAKSKGVYYIELDRLPFGHKTVYAARSAIEVLEADHEERDYSHRMADHEVEVERLHQTDYDEGCELFEGDADSVSDDDNNENSGGKKANKKARNPSKESVDAFLELDVKEQSTATEFKHCYGVKDGECITWTILADDEQIMEDSMKHDNASPMKKNIPWNEKPEEVDYNQIYFEHFFPNVKGKAKLCDEYLSNPRSPYHLTVKNSKIKFHLEDEDDPDVLVSIIFE